MGLSQPRAYNLLHNLPAVTQILSFAMDHRMDLDAATHIPRIDASETGDFLLTDVLIARNVSLFAP
jgi:hypothetical protein